MRSVSFDYPLPMCAAVFAGIVALVVMARHPKLLQSWLFLLGTLALSGVTILDAQSNVASEPEAVVRLQHYALGLRAAAAGLWLTFSVVYARGDARDQLRRWRWMIGIACIVAPVLALSFGAEWIRAAKFVDRSGWLVAFSPAAQALNIVLLIILISALVNLETTFRASIGTTRWRLKYVVLGLAVVFGVRVYARSHGLLYSGQPLDLAVIESTGLLIGAALLPVGLYRGGLQPLDVYPGRANLGQSITVFLVGGYLFVVGVLAQIIAFIGDATNFQTQAFIILVGIVAVATLVLSDRLRRKFKHLFSRYLGRSVYDFRRVWSQFSEQLSAQTDTAGVCSASAKLIAETFSVLSVRIWLLDPGGQYLRLGASTAPSPAEALVREQNAAGEWDPANALAEYSEPFNLERTPGPLPEQLRRCSPTQFENGGERWAIPVTGRDRPLGIIVLADRVSGIPYSSEELGLLRCVAIQLSATLLNVRITAELMQARELEAFQTMSAFFVHDLKNAVSTLNLMLQNLPVHFDNPEFRKDALRGIGNTVDRINHLIERLSALRKKIELRPVQTDLNALIVNAVRELNGLPEVHLEQELRPAPPISGDPELLTSVVSNLLLNARDAMEKGGTVRIETASRDGTISLTVSDQGCGMSPEFVETELFRPFSSTKNKGLGVGMFQCKIIVEAHRGSIQVKSEPGKGTTFHLVFPGQK